MSFLEKFRRTPKFVVWPLAVVLSYGIGWFLATAVVRGIDVLPPGNWLSALPSDWFFTGVYLVFCFVFAAVGTVAMTWILRLHHPVSKAEIALAAPLWFLWPVYLTYDEHALTYYRIQAAVGWSLFLISMFATWMLCARMVRKDPRTAGSPQTEATETPRHKECTPNRA